jgi:hypothetical protein
VKAVYNGPGRSFTCHKDEDGCIVSDPDARFSSNTTQKYITKTSGGSMIHTNFKINQNSLRKSVKNSSGKRRTHAPHQTMNSQKIGAGASKHSGMPHILMGAPNVAKQRL